MKISPILTNANNQSIIINSIITIHLRFQLIEISRYNFACTTNFSIRVTTEYPQSIKYNVEKMFSK